MNLNRPLQRPDSTNTTRHNRDSQVKSSDANHVHNRAVDDNTQENSQSSEFEQLLKDLKGGSKRAFDNEDSETSGTSGTAESRDNQFEELATKGLKGTKPNENADAMLGENAESSESESFAANAEDALGGYASHTSEFAGYVDISGMSQSAVMAGSEAGHSGNVEQNVSVSTTPAINAAAARIIEEMQTRVRRGEARRWQFSLPGLMGGDVSVVVDNTDGQSWHVELSLPEGVTDEDRLALEYRLTSRMDGVSLRIDAFDG